MAAEMPGAFAWPGEPGRCFNEAAANGRGNVPNPVTSSSCSTGFNEAAANGRGNSLEVEIQYHVEWASMRPRRMAAEMRHRDRRRDGRQLASMRPRRMAAEIWVPGLGSTIAVAASMRPRRMAAEMRHCREQQQ